VEQWRGNQGRERPSTHCVNNNNGGMENPASQTKEFSMKKIFAVISLLCLAAVLAMAAAPTEKTLDANYTWGKSIHFEGQTQGGATFGKYNKVHSDSIIGTATTRTLFSHFIPQQGWEYVLCRDSIGSYAGLKRDTSNIVFVLYAYAADSIDRLVGKARVDSMGGLTAALGQGSQPQQIVLPFGKTLIGSYYTLKMEPQTVKDSVWLNFFYLMPRSTTVNPKGQ
jgi:hypothetical protein